jgi:hypothetical protein
LQTYKIIKAFKHSPRERHFLIHKLWKTGSAQFCWKEIRGTDLLNLRGCREGIENVWLISNLVKKSAYLNLGRREVLYKPDYRCLGEVGSGSRVSLCISGWP